MVWVRESGGREFPLRHHHQSFSRKCAHFLSEAPEIVRGAEREPGLERWRRLAARYDPSAAEKSGRQQADVLPTESRQNIRTLAHHPSLENLEQRHRERTGDQLPEDVRLAMLLSLYVPRRL